MENPIVTWGGYAGMAFAIIMYFFFPARRKEIDSATKVLIDTLEKSVSALKEDSEIKEVRIKRQEDKILNLESRQQENILEINKIKESRDNIREILEARDKHTQDFQLKALASFTLSMQTYEIVKVGNDNMRGLNDNMKVLIDSIRANNDITKELIKSVIK